MTDFPMPGQQPQLHTDRGSEQGQPLPYMASAAHSCAETPALVLRALEGIPSPALIDAVRQRLEPCPPCIDALDREMRFKIAMSQRTTEKAPPSLQLRISESLQRIDLSGIDVTDL